MDKINYIGEHLWAAYLGRGLVLLAFVSAIVAFLAYTANTRSQNNPAADPQARLGWLRMGRWAFFAHGVGIFGTIGLIFYMMLNRFYEFEYVFSHVSDDLPFKYTFSAFWEGQEGSFLLWMFWHVVLGLWIMRKSDQWEAPVLAMVALVEVCLTSMLLGIYIGEVTRFGSSPFALLRETTFAPIFSNVNYLQQIKGNGLNPLLQNYWMTIHPPTLFLGFASTLIPFAYSIAGLWLNKHNEFLRPAIRWALWTAAVLGTGILMGGAWAYEALSFGGYWAWDPVENASLVPWITLVAGIHTALIAQNTGRAYQSTYFFFIATFFLIVYSTFLTRSGILGETSVHSFTEMGLEWQLICFLGIIFGVSLGFYLANRRSIPTVEGEESAYSREFWMFIGSLILLFSAALITWTTSLPVFNAIFGTKLAPPEDVVAHHNNYQVWIGILIAMLTALAQFFRYKSQDLGDFGRKVFAHLGLHLAISFILTILLANSIEGVDWKFWILTGTGIFAILGNTDYLLTVLRGRVAIAGASVSHIGFGVLLVGAVFSGALKRPISQGFTSVDDVLNDLNKQTNKNVLLIKNRTEPIAEGYQVTYTDDWTEGNMTFYKLNFVKKDASGAIIDSFTTTPNVLTKKEGGANKFAAANPNTKHYLGSDVFTLAVPNWAFATPIEGKDSSASAGADSAQVKIVQVKVGDTIYTSNNYMVLQALEQNPRHPEYISAEGDIAVAARFSIQNIEGQNPVIASPIYYIRENQQFDIPENLEKMGIKLRFLKIIPTDGKIEVEVSDKKPKQDYIVLQALVFPLINLVWLGSIMMMIGFLIALMQRLRKV